MFFKDTVGEAALPEPDVVKDSGMGGLTMADGERLVAVHLEGPDPQRSLGVGVAHGFTQSAARPGPRAVTTALAAHAGER